jgi:hypothetical protein
MPRKDPHTGCVVMTQAEFWASEANREGRGRSGCDLATEFWDEIEADSRACERRMLADKDGFLRTIHVWDADCDEEDRIRFTEVLEILDATVEQRVRHNSSMAVARVRTEHRGEIYVCYGEWSDAGSYYDPPDGGADLLIWDRTKVVAHLRKRALECALRRALECALERKRLYGVLESMGEKVVEEMGQEHDEGWGRTP